MLMKQSLWTWISLGWWLALKGWQDPILHLHHVTESLAKLARRLNQQKNRHHGPSGNINA
jgi:hypothetical protein